MKICFAASILILILCVFSFAQTNENAPCPAISITGPAGISSPGETVTFVANVTTDSEIKYDWTISAGTIIEGLNSPKIRIATTPEMAGSEIVATVKIKGLSENCINAASEKALISVGCGLIEDFDNFGEISPKDEKLRLAFTAAMLSEQPETSVLFVLYFPGKVKPQAVKEHLEKISNTLYQSYKITKDRIIFITGESKTRRTRIIIVPNDALKNVTKSVELSLKD